MPPSWITPSKNEPLVMVSVWPPSDTLLAENRLNSPPTLVPPLVCEMSSVPAPPENPTVEKAIEPFPFSASLAPLSICVSFK